MQIVDFGTAGSVACFVACALMGPASAQGTTLRVSVASSGLAANADSMRGVLSSDGRFSAFSSGATNLVSGDMNGDYDVFVHDSLTGATQRVSVASTGAEAHGLSDAPQISDDYRFVAFQSDAADLVPGDTNDSMDVFVHDRTTGQTERVSVANGGAEANWFNYCCAISPDGRYVLFLSIADNLAPGTLYGMPNLYLRDRLTSQTTIVSVDSNGVPGDTTSYDGSITPDARWVAFSSLAHNLVPGDSNGTWDAFVHDRVTGSTERVSVDSLGNQGNAESAAYSRVCISDDGRYVAFDSVASNLTPGDTNGAADVFVRDRATGLTERISVDSSGGQANERSGVFGFDMSADGRYVAFHSWASNLVSNDTNGKEDVFVRDRWLGTTTRATLTAAGDQSTAYGTCSDVSISADGRCVLFRSTANDFVLGDIGYTADIFMRDRFGCTPTIANFCTAGTTTHGCVASISGSGTPSASAGTGFTVAVDAVEGQVNGIIFYGTSGPFPKTWGHGSSVLCLKPPVQRTAVQSSGGSMGACDGQLLLDWNQFTATNAGALGCPLAGGESVWVQGWFRDSQAPGESNLSNALWFTVCP